MPMPKNGFFQRVDGLQTGGQKDALMAFSLQTKWSALVITFCAPIAYNIFQIHICCKCHTVGMTTTNYNNFYQITIKRAFE